MLNIFFLTNLPASYKVDFLNNVSKSTKLFVAFERKESNIRKKGWYSFNFSFDYSFCHGINVGVESSLSFEPIRIIKTHKFDKIIINGYSSPTAILTINYLIKNKIPYILMLDGCFPKGKAKGIKNRLKRKIFKNASNIFSPNYLTDKAILENDADETKIKRYPFSSVSNKNIEWEYDKNDFKAKIGFAEKKIILFVGQFILRKGIDILIDSFEEISKYNRDTILIMVGGTNKDVEKLNLKLSSNIVIMPFLNKNVLFDYYKAADLFILPSREDIWGLVINEAISIREGADKYAESVIKRLVGDMTELQSI